MLNLMEACMAKGSYWSGRLLGLLVAESKECCQAFPGKVLRLQLSSGGRLVWPASWSCISIVQGRLWFQVQESFVPGLTLQGPALWRHGGTFKMQLEVLEPCSSGSGPLAFRTSVSASSLYSMTQRSYSCLDITQDVAPVSVLPHLVTAAFGLVLGCAEVSRRSLALCIQESCMRWEAEWLPCTCREPSGKCPTGCAASWDSKLAGQPPAGGWQPALEPRASCSDC